ADDVNAFINDFSKSNVQAKYLRSADNSLLQDPSLLNGNGLITSSYPLYSRYKQQQFINHFNVNYYQPQWSLRLGHMYAHNDFSSLP
ncbi:hypothetical protein ACKI2C_50395, partial [Streptomyces brasiliscabiei]|uniref:hypothetical protein n=1 Tax=Streptomyces brasiliscabiei TaxID=2736302 RepID=UPI0038F658A3